MKKFTMLFSMLAVMLLTFQNDSIAQQPSAKVYWMITAKVPLGKLAEYHSFVEKELIPAQEKYGYKHIAAWQTIVGDIEEAVLIAEFANMEVYNTARLKFVSSEEWKKFGPKYSEFIKSVESRFLRAMPYSKIK